GVSHRDGEAARPRVAGAVRGRRRHRGVAQREGGAGRGAVADGGGRDRVGGGRRRVAHRGARGALRLSHLRRGAGGDGPGGVAHRHVEGGGGAVAGAVGGGDRDGGGAQREHRTVGRAVRQHRRGHGIRRGGRGEAHRRARRAGRLEGLVRRRGDDGRRGVPHRHAEGGGGAVAGAVG